MKWISFNDNWYVRHVEDSGLGASVTLPHDAMLSEPHTAMAEGAQRQLVRGQGLCVYQEIYADGC